MEQDSLSEGARLRPRKKGKSQRRCPFVSFEVECGVESCSARECIEFTKRVVTEGRCDLLRISIDGNNYPCMDFDSADPSVAVRQEALPGVIKGHYASRVIVIAGQVNNFRCRICTYWEPKE